MGKANGIGNTAAKVTATTSKSFDAMAGGTPTDGDTMGTGGSEYQAVLNERENKANTRNRGMTRSGGAVGDAELPVATLATRKNGKI